jgi:hypothetical protein
MLLKRYPYRPRRDHDRPDPAYGVGYRPDWPSILSVAHDTTDGGAVFVVTDRPCVIVPGPLALPLIVAGLSVAAATEVLPVKFRVAMSAAVPAGSAWTWGAGGAGPCSLVDPVTNHAPNPASGSCADSPGPYPPPGPLVLVAAELGADPFGEYLVTLTFDRAIDVAALDPSQVTLDDAAGAGWVYAGAAIDSRPDPRTLVLNMAATDVPATAENRLNATADTGIVAADDGAAWAGVAGVGLPFP